MLGDLGIARRSGALVLGFDNVLRGLEGPKPPKVLIEAAACARPLIATDKPGCREVVTDGVEGFLIEGHDAHALACAIATLDDNPQLAERMGEAARRKAFAEFDHEIVMAKTLAVYDELLLDAAPARLGGAS